MQKMTTNPLNKISNRVAKHNSRLSSSSDIDNDVFTIKPKILIVEDNLINQKVAQLFLENLGYEADIAANGQQALAIFNRGYALILMDLGLPDMDGIEITKKIRERDKHIPIIACTASGENYKAKCLAAGMNDFIIKPILLDTLKTLLAKFLPSTTIN